MATTPTASVEIEKVSLMDGHNCFMAKINLESFNSYGSESVLTRSRNLLPILCCGYNVLGGTTPKTIQIIVTDFLLEYLTRSYATSVLEVGKIRGYLGKECNAITPERLFDMLNSVTPRITREKWSQELFMTISSMNLMLAIGRYEQKGNELSRQLGKCIGTVTTGLQELRNVYKELAQLSAGKHDAVMSLEAVTSEFHATMAICNEIRRALENGAPLQ